MCSPKTGRPGYLVASAVVSILLDLDVQPEVDRAPVPCLAILVSILLDLDVQPEAAKLAARRTPTSSFNPS